MTASSDRANAIAHLRYFHSIHFANQTERS